MPVSKKRKKDGKPVHRSVPAAAAPAEPGDAAAPAAETDRSALRGSIRG